MHKTAEMRPPAAVGRSPGVLQDPLCSDVGDCSRMPGRAHADAKAGRKTSSACGASCSCSGRGLPPSRVPPSRPQTTACCSCPRGQPCSAEASSMRCGPSISSSISCGNPGSSTGSGRGQGQVRQRNVAKGCKTGAAAGQALPRSWNQSSTHCRLDTAVLHLLAWPVRASAQP